VVDYSWGVGEEEGEIREGREGEAAW